MLATVFGLPVPAWHVFFVLAVLAACLVLVFLRRLLLISAEHFSLEAGPYRAFLRDAGLFLVFLSTVYLSGLLGARFFSLLQWVGFGERMPGEEGGVYGPMAFYGGVFGGAGCMALWLVVGAHRSTWSAHFRLLADLLALPLVAGLAVGRIGCLLNGDDFGLPLPDALAATHPWWSVPSMGPGLLLRYPTQLQESAFNLVLLCAGLGVLLHRHARGWFLTNRGILGAAVVALSALNRFFNEFFRGDPRGVFPGTEWPVSQVLAGGIFLSVVLLLIVWAFHRSEVSLRSSR